METNNKEGISPEMVKSSFEFFKAIMDGMITRYETTYNEKNPKNPIVLTLSLDVIPSNEEEFIKKASLRLVLKQNLVVNMLFNRLFAFRTQEELDDTNDWGLQLYLGAFQEISYSGLTFAILNSK